MIASVEEYQYPLPIPDEDEVFRQVHKTKLDKETDRFPKESNFIPDSDGLSVYWNAYCTITNIYEYIGISYRHKKTDYKNPKDFFLFKFLVGFIRKIDGVLDVKHSPVYNGNPSPIGFPNNFAHASIIYSDDVEIRLKLADYCNQNYDTSFCPVDFQYLEKEIIALRERLNDTPYHKGK
jgi:hypothetical protein